MLVNDAPDALITYQVGGSPFLRRGTVSKIFFLWGAGADVNGENG